MTRGLSVAILMSMGTVLTSISFSFPQVLDDRNEFLKNFVNYNMLGTLGFIVAVTLPAAANIHFQLNEVENDTGKTFPRSRRSLKLSSMTLIALFVLSFALLMVKSVVAKVPQNIAMINSIAIVIVYLNVSILRDLTATVLKIPSTRSIQKK